MACTIKARHWRRYIFMMLGMASMLPPLALLEQLFHEPNMCGKVCPRLFLILSNKNGIIAGGISNVTTMWVGVLLVLGIVVVTFFFGRLWCSHFCPIGGTAELVSRGVPSHLKLRFSWINGPAFRYAYFAVFVAGSILGIGTIACKLCNFRVIPYLIGAPFVPAYRMYLSSSMGIAGLIVIGLTGFFAAGGRAYCNLLCPVGALDSLVNLVSSRFWFTYKIRTDGRLCTGCGECKKVCSLWAKRTLADTKVETDQSSCISCMDCRQVCPTGAISYGRVKR